MTALEKEKTGSFSMEKIKLTKLVEVELLCSCPVFRTSFIRQVDLARHWLWFPGALDTYIQGCHAHSKK